MRLIKRTTRWDVRHAERVSHILGSGSGVIALTWHSRFLMLTAAWEADELDPYVMISRSRDGAVVAGTCKALGLKTIRGSAKKKGKYKGGDAAAAAAMTAVRSGGCVVITPRFVLPKLFGKGKIFWGTPVSIPANTSDDALEEIRLSIETEMNALLAEADSELGHDPVEPA